MRTRDALAAVGSTQAPEGTAVRAVEAVTGWLARRTSRRGFLVRAGVLGSALAADPTGFLLTPGTAYASVCGPEASCATGWTVFCATINKGSNSCPPGSIAAGWWKSDGASLCGGKSRYIVDCNATCHCSSGRAGICSPACWSCRCTCGPAGQCDQRRVCCNAFRYGQCNEQVRQVGAVHCRVVSCTPPWKWANCSTSPATDNATRDHNSPALPSAFTAITVRYISLGENGSRLGATIGPELGAPGGKAQRYQHGRISWNPAIGARYTLGHTTARYVQLGAESGRLGYPVADPHVIGTGHASRFQRGRITWHPLTGAFETTGAILARYDRAGLETGPLGFPVAVPVVAADGRGRASRFQHGRISWHPDLGPARLLGAAVAARYAALQAESGPLGYPLADEAVLAGGRAVHLQHGRISWSAATGAWELRDVLGSAYLRSGAEAGPLGYPVGPEQAVAGGRVSRCQNGRVSASAAGAHWLRGPIDQRYVQLGAEAGQLGFPTTDEFAPAPGRVRNDFEHGWIAHDEATGLTTDSTSSPGPTPTPTGSVTPPPATSGPVQATSAPVSATPVPDTTPAPTSATATPSPGPTPP